MDMAPGTVVGGDFRIVRPLGAGGMGAVYVAVQLSTGRERALKLMRPDLLVDQSQLGRFQQEARVGAQIASEHVVEVVGAGVDSKSGVPWLAMELLAGEDLGAVVRQRGPLPPREVLEIFEQLCHALGAAHAAHIVHRDLKPENVFLGKSDRVGWPFTVKVLDFGIAKLNAEAQTKQTAAMGTPIWMAPEQTSQGVVSPATDVWALGLVAYHLLTGRLFWRSAERPEAGLPQVLREMLFEPIPTASSRASEARMALPQGFDSWFARCVVREPQQRFADASLAFVALKAAVSQSLAATAATPAAGVSRVVQPVVVAPIQSAVRPTALPPTAPLGLAQSPLAYANGEAELACFYVPTAMGEFALPALEMPGVCACCAQEATTSRRETASSRSNGRELRFALDVPMCAICAAHAASRSKAIGQAVGMGCLTVILTAVVPLLVIGDSSRETKIAFWIVGLILGAVVLLTAVDRMQRRRLRRAPRRPECTHEPLVELGSTRFLPLGQRCEAVQIFLVHPAVATAFKARNHALFNEVRVRCRASQVDGGHLILDTAGARAVSGM